MQPPPSAPALPRQRRARRQLGDLLGLRAGDALLVVDVQRDFLPGGPLAVPRAAEIIEPLNTCIEAFRVWRLPIILTRDWHPEHHCSLRSEGGQSPTHCVQGTPGAKWGEGLSVVPGARIVSKGTNRELDVYSAFSGTLLLTLLKMLEVKRLFVGGLATDYCVHDTVIDARRLGYEVVVLADAIRAVNTRADDESRAIQEMIASGATILEDSHRQAGTASSLTDAAITTADRGPPPIP